MKTPISQEKAFSDTAGHVKTFYLPKCIHRSLSRFNQKIRFINIDIDIDQYYAESSTVSHRYWPITIQISIDKINVETKQLMFQIFKYSLTYPLAGLNTDVKYECSWLPNSSDSGFGDIFIVNFQLCHTWERAVVRARIQSRSRLKCWCIVLLDTLLLSPFQS